MKPALLRALPAAALSVPLLVTGVTTATAATAAASTAPRAGVFADEGHDPAPAPTASSESVPASGASETPGSRDDEMAEHDEEMASHEEEMAEHEEEMADHEDGTSDHEDGASDHEDAESGHGDSEARDDSEDTAGEHGESDDDHSGTDDHGSVTSDGDRPRAAVLSSFVGVNAAVLAGAAFLRRRDRGAGRHRPRRTVDAGATPAASGTPAVAPTAPASVDAES